MRKALLTVLLVSVIVFVSISFMGASCTVGPVGPVTYTVTVNNTFGVTVTMEIWNSAQNAVVASAVVGVGGTGQLQATAGQYLRILQWGGWGYYVFPSTLTTWYLIPGSGGGGWVTEMR